MTLIFEFDLGNVKINQYANYQGQRLVSSKVIVQTHRHAHTERIGLSGPLKCLSQ